VLCYIIFVTLVTVMVMLILLVWRIGFVVTGMEFVGVMPTVQDFVRCDAGSMWIVIIPKSKDRFMERPPMKQYNHEPIWVWPGVVRGRV
jgi:hypothetical protein